MAFVHVTGFEYTYLWHIFKRFTSIIESSVLKVIGQNGMFVQMKLTVWTLCSRDMYSIRKMCGRCLNSDILFNKERRDKRDGSKRQTSG